MFRSFKSLKTVRTLFDQAGNLYRVAKRVLEKVGSRFRDGYKRFAKNSLFYTEALPTVTGVTASYTKGAGFESINQSQVAGLRSFSAYDIIGASSIDDQYLTFKPNVSSSDYPKPTFDPDDSVGAGIFTKSLWNHNLVVSSNVGQPNTFPINDSFIESVEINESPVEGATAWEAKSKQDRSSAANGIFSIPPNQLNATWDWNNSNIIFSLYVKFPDPDNLPTMIEVRVIDATQPQRHSAFNIYPSTLSSLSSNPSSEDVGNGWYRVSFKATLTPYNDGYTFNGDKLQVYSYLHYSGIGKKVWFAAPQLEKHPIRGLGDTNVYSGLDYAFEYDPDPHSGFAGTLNVWNVGNNVTGSDTGFEYRIDPFGKESVVALLKDGSPDASEGVAYNYTRYAVDRTTKHRVSFFFKRQRTGGTIELGMYNSRTKRVGDHPNYGLFQSSQHPATTTLLNDNEWYLQVGYIHDTSTATTDATTGWYRLDGTKVDHGDINFADLYFDPAYPSEPIGLMFRRFSAPHNDGNEFQIFGPRIDVVNGNEPSIEDLLNPVDNVNYGTITKATPYVGNDAIPANVHRHNWLQYTDDLTDPYWTQNSWTYEASTVGTTIFNGETCLSFSGHPTNYGPGSIQKNIATSDLSFDLNERYVASIYFKQGNDPATAASAIEISCDDNTNPFAGYTLRLVFNTYGGPPARLNGSSYWGYEDVGDGWYRIWVRTPGGSYASKTLNGDQIKFTAGLQVQQNNHQGFFMRPMLERLPIDQAESDPPTAYQEVSDNTWPSVSAIPYHQVAKEVELSIKDDTTGSSYTAKAYWDGGKLYNYGPRITNQDVEITQLQDGWHKFGTGIRGLGDGTINTGDTASMTFSYAASSNPRSKTLISGPILANTGSEKSSKVNYSVGTQTPGVNFISNTADWDDYFGGSFLTPANPAVITMDKINTPGPYDPSSFIFSSDEGVQQSRDYVLYYPYSGRNEVKFSESDTVVTHVHAKSLWNYNELPYTRNILDDPYFTDGSDQYGSFYSHAGEYTVVDGETGPDGYSKVLSFTSPFVTPNRTALIYPYFNWSWYNHRWDENMISTFSVFVKAPDNADETPTQMMLQFFDITQPQDAESQYFDWGPNQEPKEALGHAKSKGYVEDVGDGWYRLSVSVSGLLDEDGIKTENGDKQRIQWYVTNYEAGQNFKMCQPQMEHHIINDTNLLKPSWDWYEIQGPTTINDANGWVGYGPGENGIELREDPFGLSSLCWVGYDYNAPDPQDGGYTDSPFVDIDPNSTYRYSFFAKLGKEKPTGNRSLYAGPDSYNAAIDTDQSVRGLDGTQNSNPYMIAGINEGNLQNDWHLFVFHLQPSGTATPASNLSNTGVYRLDGSKIITGNDMLLDSTTSRLRFRAFAWSVGDDDDGTDAINLWSPRVEKVDGTEPSITELLASGNLWTNPNYQQTLPSPYVENVGIHPNPHRHNWLDYTNDLTESSYWTLGQGSFTASSVPTTYANGETCFVYNMPATGTSNFILYGGFPGSLAKSWDEDNQYVASVYMKQLDAAFSSFNFAFGDVTDAQRESQYTIDFNITDTSNVTFTGAGSDVNSYGYESLPEGWIRVWWSVDSSGQAGTVDGDNMRLYLYLYGPGASDFNAMYGKQGVALMRPMVEILPIGSTINNVPRAYQEVDGEWNLGVTSIPEHQCSTEVELWPSDWDAPTAAFKTTFDREGGVWRTDYTQSAVNMSSEHVGDGWYKLTTSISGTTSNPSTVEGDNMRVVFYPTQFDPDKDITAFSLISAPFIGMTGSLDVSSVPHTRGVLE